MRSRRKQIFLVLLPSLFMLCLYVLIFGWQNYRYTKTLQNRGFQLASDLQMLPIKLQQDEKKSTELQTKLQEKQKEITQFQEKMKQLRQNFPSGNHLEILAEINALSKNNQTVLVESNFKDINKQLSNVPSEILQYYREIQQAQQIPLSEKIVVLEILGRFSDVHQFLFDVSKLHFRIFPLQITMKHFKKNFHRWEIVLWIE